MIDTHVHIDDTCFTPDLAETLYRAKTAGVEACIVPAISYQYWPRLRAVCQEYPYLYPAYGLHPMYLAEHASEHLDALLAWLATEPAVAVGECGLDYYVAGLDKSQQIKFFVAQLELAKAVELPVIVHARRAVDDVTKYLRQTGVKAGVVHSFSGSLQQAENLLALGFYLSFGGPITYPRANKLRNLVKQLPLERILLETDAPDQPLSTHRGERNEPAYLPEVLHTVAELRQQAPATIANVTTANAKQLFGLQA